MTLDQMREKRDKLDNFIKNEVPKKRAELSKLEDEIVIAELKQFRDDIQKANIDFNDLAEAVRNGKIKLANVPKTVTDIPDIPIETTAKYTNNTKIEEDTEIGTNYS